MDIKLGSIWTLDCENSSDDVLYLACPCDKQGCPVLPDEKHEPSRARSPRLGAAAKVGVGEDTTLEATRFGEIAFVEEVHMRRGTQRFGPPGHTPM